MMSKLAESKYRPAYTLELDLLGLFSGDIGLKIVITPPLLSVPVCAGGDDRGGGGDDDIGGGDDDIGGGGDSIGGGDDDIGGGGDNIGGVEHSECVVAGDGGGDGDDAVPGGIATAGADRATSGIRISSRDTSSSSTAFEAALWDDDA